MNIKKRIKMNTRSLKRGNFARYSFRDLEYGLKLINGQIEEMRTAVKVIEKINNHKQLDGYRSHKTDFIEAEIEKLDQVVKLVQSEIADRLLTGNDDNVVIRELLGAQGV